jgi:hypothetical protein
VIFHIEARAEMIKETHSLIAENSSGLRDIFLNRHTIIKIAITACLGITAVLYGLRITTEGPEESAVSERKGAMFLARQNSGANQEIPPIDLSAPAKTESATFALG